MVLGVFGTVLLGLVTVLAMTNAAGGGLEMDGVPMSPTSGVLFLSFILLLPWVVVGGLLCSGVRGKHTKHSLRIQHGHLDYVQALFGKERIRRLALTEIESIAAKVFYEQNYRPVYGVEVRSGRKKIRFGSTLDDAEKGWLVAELKAVVFPK